MHNLGVVKNIKAVHEDILSWYIVLGGYLCFLLQVFVCGHGRRLVKCSTCVWAEGPHSRAPPSLFKNPCKLYTFNYKHKQCHKEYGPPQTNVLMNIFCNCTFISSYHKSHSALWIRRSLNIVRKKLMILYMGFSNFDIFSDDGCFLYEKSFIYRNDIKIKYFLLLFKMPTVFCMKRSCSTYRMFLSLMWTVVFKFNWTLSNFSHWEFLKLLILFMDVSFSVEGGWGAAELI